MKPKTYLRIPLRWPPAPFWQRLGRALIPNLGTVLVVAGLLFVSNAFANPFRTASLASSSTTTISYQGRLLDTAGNPVNSSGLNMSFRLYDSDVNGTLLWSEDHIAVPVQDGLFHVLLGSVTPIPVLLLEDNDILWLGVQVGSDTEMTPREQIASVPYAMVANTVVNGAVTTDKVADGSITTGKMAAGAATQIQAISAVPSYSTSSTSFVDMPGQTITLATTGGPILAMFSGSHYASAVGVVGYWRIIRDDSIVIAYNNRSFLINDEWTTTTLFGTDTPPAGSHTYKVQWRVSTGTLTASEATYTENFAVVEFKR